MSPEKVIELSETDGEIGSFTTSPPLPDILANNKSLTNKKQKINFVTTQSPMKILPNSIDRITFQINLSNTDLGIWKNPNSPEQQ